MIGKILQATKGRPCSCPSGKICTACKNKKAVRVKPRVAYEGSSALPVPIKITTYKDKTPSAVQVLKKKEPVNRYQNQAHTKSENRGTKICQWYRQKKALRQLARIDKLEKKRLEYLRREKLRRDREAELLEHLMQREKEIRIAEQQLLEQESSRKIFEPQRARNFVRNEGFEFKNKKRKQKKNEVRDPYYEEFDLKKEKKERKEEKEKQNRKEKEYKKKQKIEEKEYKKKQKRDKKEKKKEEKRAKKVKKIVVPEVYDSYYEDFEPINKKTKSEIPEDDLSYYEDFELKKKKRKQKKLKPLKIKPSSESRWTKKKHKQYRPKDSFNERFANFCYRICCQFYCCMTIILLIALIIIFII